MMTFLTIVAVLAAVGLAWNLYGRFGVDRIAEFTERRRAGSLLVSRGEFVDGNRHMEVALAVTPSTLFYENGDMQASLDLEWIREVEYDDELGTGSAVAHGKVLRLRSDSQTFEFVVPDDAAAKWYLALPARGAAHAVAATA